MTTPVTRENFPIHEATQKVCADLNSAALAIKRERNEAFDKQPKWKKVAYPYSEKTLDILVEEVDKKTKPAVFTPGSSAVPVSPAPVPATAT